ncbi:hypothetical protein DEI81_00260 [Curtobacterium sp. MCBD17_013]|uniref:hypothetical protein n=1 Tax=Curtobacterium sp. MCBD17_013 TaxID=2175668 RepID=UPI000DA7A05D|nr:hypothetical protein [Curtobacterium sp. MCBD17_013]PZF66113.1 hypothetical protein DEI81_00260 [Curtobacterium sp. MCBD17_013]
MARQNRVVEQLFDLRMIIAVLFTIYGIVCLVWGLAFTTQRELDKAAGTNVNLWAGIGMLVVAALFVVWVVRSPLTAQAERAQAEQTED